MNRRGFIGALAGLPIAAVVRPKVSVPEVTASQTYTTSAGGAAHFTYTIHIDGKQLARALADETSALLMRGSGGGVPRGFLR